MTRVVAFIQARMTSSRLPGKVLEPILGKPSILFMIERLKRARRIDSIVVVTSDHSSDDPLANVLAEAGVLTFRGSLDDVLSRFRAALDYHPADVIVRLTGDCPLIDPAIVDAVVSLHLESGADYTSNIDPPSFPDGMDVEVFSAESLMRAGLSAQLISEREHVTPWMRSTRSGLQRVNLRAVVDLSALRLTVDYADDLTLVRQLSSALEENYDSFDLFDILRVLQANTDLLKINLHERNEGLLASIESDACSDD
jgi:spore coat polysaccharide biosynthesis protein SpsF